MREFNYKKSGIELFTPEIINLISQIHEYKGKQEMIIEAHSDILNSMLKIARIQSTGASNRIEGIYTTDERLTKIVNEKVEPRNRSEQEIAGYREVLSTIHDSYEYITIRPNILLQLHRDLYSFSPMYSGGSLKNSDNVITEEDSEGNRRVRFQPASAFETPELLEKLCDEFSMVVKEEQYDPLLLIPVFILDFLSIHPFDDGNGRMSRLLTLLLLYKYGYIVGKYISIEMIIEKTKETYYEVLHQSSIKWNEGNNVYNPFVKYYLGIILNAYKEFSDRVEHLKYRNLSKGERIRNIFNKKVGKIKKGDLVILCPDISVATIENTLGDLVKEEYILKVGAGPSTAYIKNYEK